MTIFSFFEFCMANSNKIEMAYEMVILNHTAEWIGSEWT